MFSPGWRQEAIAGLGEPFDLLVLGGGITGCGILLDAATRGLRALLVEKSDFASGTSSRSSKLIHGGFRYLKNLQLRTTAHASRERELQLANQPHLVEPLHFVFPVWQGDRPPGWMVDFGLWLYDRFTRAEERHRRLGDAELAARAPGLRREGLERALYYLDARVDDARLTYTVAATAYAAGGLVLTRALPEEARLDGPIKKVVLRDLETGAVHTAEARLVINATGVWADELRLRFGLSGRRLRPSRGTHLVFARERLPLSDAVAVLSPDDRRPIFFLPHPEGTLLGTTDLFHDGGLEDPRPTRAEVDYLLRAAAVTFPASPVGEKDIVGAFAGIRPVIDDGAADPSKASREEAIWEERGLLSIAGGKLTTWRLMAAEVLERALRLLPEERRRRAKSGATLHLPLIGRGPADLEARLRARGLEPGVARGLARRLGSFAPVALREARDGELLPLAPGSDLSLAEARFHLRYGAALHLGDLLLRRVRAGLWQPALAAGLPARLRPLLGEELGWDARRIEREEEAFGRELEAFSVGGIDPTNQGGAR